MSTHEHSHHVAHKIVSAGALLSAAIEHASRGEDAREETYPLCKVNGLPLAVTKGFDELVDTVLDDGLKLIEGRAAEGVVPGFAMLHVPDGVTIANHGRRFRPHIPTVEHCEKVSECPSSEGKLYKTYWRSWACLVGLARA